MNDHTLPTPEKQTAVTVYKNPGQNPIRSFIDENGEPWFVAADIFMAFEIENSSKGSHQLDDDEKSYATLSNVKYLVMNQSGLYSLVLSSRKKGVVPLRKFIIKMMTHPRQFDFNELFSLLVPNNEFVKRIKLERRAARKKRGGGSYTAGDILILLQRQRRRCYYCGENMGDKYTIEHVVPLSRGGSNSPENIVLACLSCNLRKNDKLPHEWFKGGRLM